MCVWHIYIYIYIISKIYNIKIYKIRGTIKKLPRMPGENMGKRSILGMRQVSAPLETCRILQDIKQLEVLPRQKIPWPWRVGAR